MTENYKAVPVFRSLRHRPSVNFGDVPRHHAVPASLKRNLVAA